MKVIQKALNSLYGAEIEKIDFNFRLNTVDILLKVVEGEVILKIGLFFSEVSNYKMNKDWVHENWDVISVFEIFHIPELGEEYSIEEKDRQSYNYIIDGDGFDLFIKANNLEIQENIL